MTGLRLAKIMGLLGAVVTVGVVGAVLGFRALTYWTGPFLDEWHCSDGERPVTSSEGGSYCAKPNADLRPGEFFDPLGNRPFDCTNRHGWVTIKRPVPAPEQSESECWPEGKALSDEVRSQGWSFDEDLNEQRGWWR